MASISSLGSGSNLDLESLLTKLVDAEKTPQQTQITNRKALANATISALGSLKSKLSAFRDAQAKLKDPTFFSGKTATSSDTSLFTVSATGTAAAGTYNVGVINLASANKIASGNFTDPATTVGNGTLTIGVGGSTFDVTVTAGVNDTLAGIRDSINNAANNTGVKASILTISDGLGGTASKLVLTANNTGASSQISVAVTDGDATNTDNAGLSQLYYLKSDAGSQLSEVNAAQDAKITVDGFAATSATNQFASVIEGVTITAVKGAADPLNPPTGALAVTADKTTVQAAVQSFVNAYNDLAKAFSSLTTYNKDSGAGGLSGDSSLLTIRARVKQILADPVSGAPGDFNSLAFLGISTNKDGTLSTDNTKLTNALTNRLNDVATLFSGSDGVSVKFDSLLGDLVSSSGIFQTRENALNDQLRSLDDQQSALDTRIESFTKRYRAQFTALDTLVTQLNSTGSFLTQQLDAAAKIISRKSN
jgi:flagellar hook-associated protein 2